MQNITDRLIRIKKEIAPLKAKLNFVEKGSKKYEKIYTQLEPLLKEQVSLEEALAKEQNIRKEQEERQKELFENIRLNYKNIIVSTTPMLEGYTIEEYIGIESAEVVAGTSVIKDFCAGISDFLGTRSKGYGSSLSNAKKQAFEILKYKCALFGGNAVVGIDIDYLEVGTMMGVIVNGTIVKVRKRVNIENTGA